MISGIGWVSELVEAAGGIDIFPEQAREPSAKGRIVSAEAVISAAPDIVIGSWCGKKFRPERFAARPGFERLPAVRDGFLREIKSPLILQPGPAALTDGLAAIEAISPNGVRRKRRIDTKRFDPSHPRPDESTMANHLYDAIASREPGRRQGADPAARTADASLTAMRSRLPAASPAI